MTRGITFNYSTDVTLTNVSLRGNGQFDTSGVFGDLGPRDLAFNNDTITDWGTGITFPASSSMEINGGTYNNTVDFRIPSFDPGTAPGLSSRSISIANVSFLDSPLPSLVVPSPNSVHYRVLLDGTLPGDGTGTKRFLADRITYNGLKVDYNDQAANAVVTGTGIAAYDGKTNAQLKAAFGIATRARCSTPRGW